MQADINVLLRRFSASQTPNMKRGAFLGSPSSIRYRSPPPVAIEPRLFDASDRAPEEQYTRPRPGGEDRLPSGSSDRSPPRMYDCKIQMVSTSHQKDKRGGEICRNANLLQKKRRHKRKAERSTVLMQALQAEREARAPLIPLPPSPPRRPLSLLRDIHAHVRYTGHNTRAHAAMHRDIRDPRFCQERNLRITR